LGDFLYDCARLLVVTLPGDICLRDDADEPAVFFDYGKTAYLMPGHDSQFVVFDSRREADILVPHHHRRVRNGLAASTLQGSEVMTSLML